MDLADRIRRGVDALRQGRPEAAVEALTPVVADPELAAATDLEDVRARVCSLLAQALLDSGRPGEAQAPLREALRLAKRLGDKEAEKALATLQLRLVALFTERHKVAEQARELAKVADTPLEDLLRDAGTDAERAATLVRKATAELEVGRAASALPLAREAASLAQAAGNVREEVLARLLVASSDHEVAASELATALALATAADEFNLVAAVVRTAELTGVALPSEPFAGKAVD